MLDQVARIRRALDTKDERRIRPDELVRLASFYGRSVGEFLPRSEPVEAFAGQSRAAAPDALVEASLAQYILEFQRLCKDYLGLQRICAAP